MVKVTTTTIVNITPEWPMYICGHAMRTGKHTGIHDELEVILLALEIDNEKFIWMTADISNFDNDAIHYLKNYIVEYYHISYDNIIISAVHSHSAPMFTTSNVDTPHDDIWRKAVISKIIQGVDKCLNKGFQEVARVKYTVGESEGLYGNRNSKEKYGDTNIYVIEFKDVNDETISTIVNMSCHSTVLSPEELNISGDLLAAVRRELIPYLKVTPLVCNGNAGDVSNRLYRQNNDFEELKRISSKIAKQISEFTTTFNIQLKNPKTRSFTYIVDYEPNIENLQQRLIDSEKQLATSTEYDDRKWLISEISGFKRKIKAGHVHLELETTIINLNDLEIIIMPCELVSAFGRQIKNSSQAKACFIWGYANGQNGYVVEASEYNGGHDGISTQFPKGKAEEYVSMIIQNLF